MKDFLNLHFDKIAEVTVLVFIFVFATCMLAYFKSNEEMARWIENGAVITILARSFGSAKSQSQSPSPDAPPATQIVNSSEKPQ